MMQKKNNHNLPFFGAYAIQDVETTKIIKNFNYSNVLWDESVNQTFCNLYRSWILSNKTCLINCLENFKYASYSNGTSESFNLFYIKNRNRRFRCFKGEYIYHQLAWRNNWPNWKFIEDEELSKQDAVIISLPFSNTGNKHQSHDKILEICEELNIPVLVDCAYFGICNNIEFDFSYSCITDITFSLSKTFPVANARIGMRFTRSDDDDLIFVYNKMNYNNRLGAALGIELLKNFSPEYIYTKYANKQKVCCNILNVEPSNTVIFGLDKASRFNEYSRGSTESNRLGFHKLYEMTETEMRDTLNASTISQ